ncbi:MAG: hypothetical protein CME13_07210 [Gemmatimonadetes bacterium]|nr:hypothetical protein [Gemmatimonadota bacterium]MDP7362836.1 hypothetical protein [Candidatus Latescibacterota bacterium]MDP7633385.1 hypothetical protein [Candidatus Latescibacterota bacterium]
MTLTFEWTPLDLSGNRDDRLSGPDIETFGQPIRETRVAVWKQDITAREGLILIEAGQRTGLSGQPSDPFRSARSGPFQGAAVCC